MGGLDLQLRTLGRFAAGADVLLAVALTVFAQLNLRFNIDQSTHYGSGFATAVATGVATLVIALRRRAPLLTVCVVAAAVAAPELVTLQTITLWGHFVPLLIALYSVARHAGRAGSVAGAAVTVLALGIVMVRVPAIGTVANVPFNLVPFAGAVVAGRVLASRHRRHAAVDRRARQLVADRDDTIRTAVTEERNRIARELHDIVAHCISVMVVQAGAAEDLLDRSPERARQPLRAVQDTGGQAVGELGRMLGLLRGDGAEIALAPQPGTAQLPDLIDQVARAGLPVTLDVQGMPTSLPPGVELTLYRVTQEALTNTLKHAAPTTAHVVLRYGDDVVQLDVTDEGRSSGPPGSGHGLIGMRERVRLYAGSLRAGPRPEGGFAVHARLPIDGAAR